MIFAAARAPPSSRNGSFGSVIALRRIVIDDRHQYVIDYRYLIEYLSNDEHQVTQLEDPRLEWMSIQEAMLRDYLQTAQEALETIIYPERGSLDDKEIPACRCECRNKFFVLITAPPRRELSAATAAGFRIPRPERRRRPDDRIMDMRRGLSAADRLAWTRWYRRANSLGLWPLTRARRVIHAKFAFLRKSSGRRRGRVSRPTASRRRESRLSFFRLSSGLPHRIFVDIPRLAIANISYFDARPACRHPRLYPRECPPSAIRVDTHTLGGVGVRVNRKTCQAIVVIIASRLAGFVHFTLGLSNINGPTAERMLTQSSHSSS
ncbi:Protein kibra [Eumeta japonica]|uniref:Protein kibra n=1 Tax=Eumeta variegata TaxID=151549 RepID=A0A4C1TUQ2_EUMVA|nr:Protein kibra [Eumeta japonica]